MHVRTAFIALALALTPTAALAEGPATTLVRDDTERAGRATHGLYLEAATALFANGVSVNYDHRFDDHFGVRLGYSGSMFLFGVTGGGGVAHGPLVMGTFVAGTGPVRFEADLGFSIVEASDTTPFEMHLGGDLFFVPNAFVGVRISPVEGGFLFRAGATLTGAWAAGTSIAFGATF